MTDSVNTYITEFSYVLSYVGYPIKTYLDVHYHLSYILYDIRYRYCRYSK